MVKVIRIKDCAECPFKTIVSGYNGYEPLCKKVRRAISGPCDIPDWCPLEDL
jgi:hypothetical protein